MAVGGFFVPMENEPLDLGQGESKFERLVREGVEMLHDGADLTQVRKTYEDQGIDPEQINYIVRKLSDLQYEDRNGPTKFEKGTTKVVSWALIIGGALLAWALWFWLPTVRIVSTVPFLIMLFGLRQLVGKTRSGK